MTTSRFPMARRIAHATAAAMCCDRATHPGTDSDAIANTDDARTTAPAKHPAGDGIAVAPSARRQMGHGIRACARYSSEAAGLGNLSLRKWIT
jgi:hypothetical protein